MDKVAASQTEGEDSTLRSRDSYTFSPEDLSVDSNSSEKKIENKEKELDHGDPWGLSLKDTSTPTVTDLWPEFRHGKTLHFSRLFENQKTPTVWQEVRRRLRKRKKQKAQCPPNPTLGGPQKVRSPGPEECLTDDEIKMMAPVVPQPVSQLSDCSQNPHSEEVALWRYGPAKFWYDMLGVPPHGRGFDYGFRLREKSPEEEETTQTDHPLLKDENFLMVTQKSWEDDIIWDNRNMQNYVPDAQKVALAGWIPSDNTKSFETGTCDPSQPGGSIFIPESEALIRSQWEDNIIWDAQAMPKPLYPPVLTIDPDDENLLLFDIEEPEEVESPAQKQLSEKSQMLQRCGIKREDKAKQTPAQLKAKDPWNLSNDEFYFPQQHGLHVFFKDPIIQHSLPALKLHSSLFPTHMGAEQLSLLHRPPVRWLGKGPHPVHDLTCHIQKKAQEREQELQASGGGHMFFMKTIQDLSGQDGDLILVEWSEENPPFLNQIGMASQIQNYYKKKNGKDTGPPAYKYGNLVFCSSSPFLGQLHAGQFLQALENKLFRAPIYPHQMAETDFLVVVTKAGYFLREAKDIFTAGQQCPLDEVPAPNSKKAKNYIHEFLQVFIYRQFWKSPHRPRRIRMEEIHRAFPRLSESSIRRRLTKCSDFHRTGIYFNWWVLKAGFHLPSEEELRDMVTPEKCCALYSMQAAQQRLKDAGYGEISLLSTEEASDENVCLNDEVQAAPWNTTRAFLAATKGQCLLEVTGVADPTGCGEGISYVKVACKPKQGNITNLDAGRVKGTDADLRRLTLKEAQKLLRKSEMSEEEIQKLSRWEVVAAIRALSTKKLHLETKTKDLTRFARAPHSSGAKQQRHYQQEVQRIFDLQNRVLASTEVLTTDTDSSSSDEENDPVTEQMCREIENLLEGKTSPQRLQREKEKQERQELQQLMLQDKGKKEKQNGSAKTLVIHRTYIDESGNEHVQSETVQDPAVIDAYIFVRSTKDEDSIQKILLADEQKQQELRKEKKRLQDKLRRIRKAKERKEQKEKLAPKKLLKPEAPKLSLICGNCGSRGHIKTNKICPKYCVLKDLAPGLKVMTQEQEEKELAKRLPQESLIKPQGTKIFMKGKLFETMNEVQREALRVRFEKLPLHKKSQSGPPQKKRSMPMTQKSQPGPPQKRQYVFSPQKSQFDPPQERRSMPMTQERSVPVHQKSQSDPFQGRSVPVHQKSQSGPPQKKRAIPMPQKSQSGPPQKRQCVSLPQKSQSDPPQERSVPMHQKSQSGPPQKKRSIPVTQKSQSGLPQERSVPLPQENQSDPAQKKRSMPMMQKGQSGPPQKRQRVHMDPNESLSCIRHPCQPALPCPPFRRNTKSHPVLSPQVALERPERTSGKLMVKPLQNTLPLPVQSAQSEPEPPSEALRKDWSLQNWLQNKYRSLTGPFQKEPDLMTQTQKPVIPPPTADPIPLHLLSHSAKKFQKSLTCSKSWLHDSSSQQCKRPRNSLCQPGQELTQEPTTASRYFHQDKLDRSLQRSPLDKDTQPVLLQKSGAEVPQIPSQNRITKDLAPKHQGSILYEDLQVSDTDEEEEKEEIETRC